MFQPSEIECVQFIEAFEPPSLVSFVLKDRLIFFLHDVFTTWLRETVDIFVVKPVSPSPFHVFVSVGH